MNNYSEVLRTKEAAAFVGVSEATFFLISKQADFPKKLHLSAKARGYRRGDLEKWLKSREVRS